MMRRRVLTGKRLGEMTADEAAAYFVAHHDDELTEAERRLLTSWISADGNHARAMKRAEAIWQIFDQAAGEEILDEMRGHSREVRIRH